MNAIWVGVVAALFTLAALRVFRLIACRRRFGRRGRGFFVRRLFRRLEATPEQERLFLDEIEALGRALRDTRRGIFGSREELARLLRADSLDAKALDEYGSRQVAVLDTARRLGSEALARIHAALDARQRLIFAELIASPAHGCR